jgi:hypothetical protein
MKFEPQQVLLNARKATTEDLLDRVTVYRDGMEPDALPILEGELRSRGVTAEQIEAHQQQRQNVVRFPDGIAAKCSQRDCYRPAIVRRWGWHRLWFGLPVFPRLFYDCEEHQPK